MEEKCFSPIQIGSIKVKNRFIMSSMNSRYTKDGLLTNEAIAYYRERARGGFGLLMTEFLAIEEAGKGGRMEPSIWDDDCIAAFLKLTTSVHEAGSKIFAQLHHAGMISVQKENLEVKGPSMVSLKECPTNLHVLSEPDIDELVGKFVNASVRAKKSGFDGVEIHAAHGYLICQFLSLATNKRFDKYGGGYENRFRFLRRIVGGIKIANGQDYPVSVKISALEDVEDGISLNDAVIFAKKCEQAGADMINVSYGGTGKESPIQSYYRDKAFNRGLSHEVKQHVSVPVAVSGRITDEDMAELILGNKDADLVALGRQSLCDPYFPKKMQDGRCDLIMHCAGCLQRCSPAIGCEESDQGISCMLNPFSGKETRWRLAKFEKRKKIIIVGGGVAGLQCAWLLAKRGAEVDLYEAKDYLGGNACVAAIPFGKSTFIETVHTMIARGKEYGVTYHMSEKITDAHVFESADIVIDASGSSPLQIPSIKGLEEYSIFAEDVLKGKERLIHKKILILGSGLVGMETAEILSASNQKITLMDMADEVAKDMVPAIKNALLSHLEKNSVEFILGAAIKNVFENGIYYEKDDNLIKIEGYDCIINALGYRGNQEIQKLIEKENNTFFVIGDAKRARNMKMSIYEASKLAVEMED